MVQEIVGGHLGWGRVVELLNASYIDEAVLHFMRVITAMQMLSHQDDYIPFLMGLDDPR